MGLNGCGETRVHYWEPLAPQCQTLQASGDNAMGP